MTEVKPPKPTLAQQRIAFLREYASKLEAFRSATSHTYERSEWTPAAKELEEYLRVERPELQRVFSQIDSRLPPPERMNDVAAGLAVAVREWERADELAKDRVAVLKAFLREVRELESLELRVATARQRLDDMGFTMPADRGDLRADSEVPAMRDALCEEQPAIERMLNDVGCSLSTYTLAAGAHGIVDFVAGQIGKAVGLYREWPTTKLRSSGTRAVPAEAPTRQPVIAAEASLRPTPTVHIVNNNTLHLNVAMVLEQLTLAVEEAAPPEKKSIWRDTLKEIAGSAAGAGVKAALEKLLGSGGA